MLYRFQYRTIYTTIEKFWLSKVFLKEVSCVTKDDQQFYKNSIVKYYLIYFIIF